ncbi:Lysophospholipase, alpha-beta hydrolase superfamily [Pseudovibrio denitrificans]|uniref:Lysophospholipase, alpha-beta hydrolase superfamily n=2 Tax=Pseudovibrio denitrificans TaxID=258256 RepID=A0A1I7DM34_9HYPH|nr:Lysophospholipase, alpha-beta hydrolase superfamily [Pseudovibrio denitrificans]
MTELHNDCGDYTVSRSVEGGIERVRVLPKEKRHQTPILFQHGMWHGAWCWLPWQEILAQHGWESWAISLPGHGGSPTQRPVRFCSLDYYLGFLKAEIEQSKVKPIYIGHSMGGALGQRYLKKVADDLPAMVLVASWTSHSTWFDGMGLHLKRDPLGLFLSGFTFSTQPFVRNAQAAASMLITEGGLCSAEELYEKLGPESALVLNQHNPPFWQPKQNPQTPMLWVSAEKDAVISSKGARKSAEFYHADFIEIEGNGHNLMMESNYASTVSHIHDWLEQKQL